MPATAPSRVQLANVIAHHGEAYRKSRKLPVQHLKTLFAVEACRSARLGAHTYACDKCDHHSIRYNSCRNRHCPRCQLLNKEKWVEQLGATLLPVRYFHVVFTLPSELNRLCLVNQKVMYDLLFQSASQTILTLCADEKRLDVYTGLVAVLHTWGQTLTEHPHLHTMVPAGGWSEVNGYWKSSGKKFLLPVKVVSRVFRGKMLSGLKALQANNELKFEGEIKALQSKKSFQQLIDALYQKDWVVYCKAPFKNATAIVKYLGNYSHRVAISNERLISVDESTVTFRYKDYKHPRSIGCYATRLRSNRKRKDCFATTLQGQRKTMTLEGTEFIRRFLLHVLPKGFCKIRYYGLLSVRHRSGKLRQCRRAMGIAERKSRFEGLNWQQVMKLISGRDVTRCPCCKEGTMISIGHITPERSPPR